MHIFFSVGEPSGDQHAAHLVRELQARRPGIKVSGFGGPMMQAEGVRILYRLTDLAVMFLWSVLPLLRKFIRLVGRAERFFADEKPDAVVLVDFPGFNWHIARKAKAAGIPVFYYLPPQMWAWAPWRARKMRKFVDHVLCGLPFEPEWYARRGINAEYVGHPFFDEVASHDLDEAACESMQTDNRKLLGVLPGSRNKEIERNWPTMLDVLQRIHTEQPDVRFVVASYNEKQAARCREIAKEKDVELPLEYRIGVTPEVIDSADCCFMVSGSVSLEMLARTTPAVVLYHITRIARFAKWVFLNVPFITLPNLFANEAVLPEWIVPPGSKNHVDEMTSTLCGWLGDDTKRQAAVDRLAAMRNEVVRPGATANTADAIVRRLHVEGQQLSRAA